MGNAFKNISAIKFEGPDSKNPLAFAITTPTKWSKARRCASICASPSSTGTRSAARAPIRSAPAPPCGPGTTARTRSPTPRSARAWHSSSSRSSARPSMPSTTATSRPKAATLRETNANLDAVVEGAQGGAEAHRHQAALGHRQSLFQPPFRPRRGHQLQRRRVRLRRGPGEEGARSHPRTRRRRLRLLGRPRRVLHAAQHRPEARAGASRPVPAPGGGLQEGRSASRASSTSSRSRRSRPSTSTIPTPPPA